MSISARTLRNARHQANLTQSELAERLGVSPRTVVNWEKEGGSVPARSEWLVASVLGLETEGFGSGESEARLRVPNPVPPALHPVPQSLPLRAKENSKIQVVFEGNGLQDPARQAIVEQVVGVVELAEWSSERNVDPIYLAEMLEALINIVMNTGLASEMVSKQGDLLGWVLRRSEALLDNQLETYNYEPGRTFARVSFKSYIEELADKRRDRFEESGGYIPADFESAASDDGLPRMQGDVGGSTDDGVPENVEQEWGLAAHPKTELPEDHTP